jgi:hypothetical protein
MANEEFSAPSGSAREVTSVQIPSSKLRLQWVVKYSDMPYRNISTHRSVSKKYSSMPNPATACPLPEFEHGGVVIRKSALFPGTPTTNISHHQLPYFKILKFRPTMAEDQKEQTFPSSAAPIPYSIFTSRQKALIVTIVSIASTFSGFASNIYFPAIPAIAVDLSSTTELGKSSLT